MRKARNHGEAGKGGQRHGWVESATRPDLPRLMGHLAWVDVEPPSLLVRIAILRGVVAETVADDDLEDPRFDDEAL